MDVGARGEGGAQPLDPGHMGDEPKLDLGIVGRDQLEALSGHEGVADLAAFLGADGDVLKVGVA